MTALAPRDVEGFCRRPDLSKRVVLVYGPDVGLASERAEALARAHLGDSADPFALVRIDGDVLESDPARLTDEARTVALFGGRRVIWVRVGTRPIHRAVELLLAAPMAAAVVLQAGDLSRTSPLRKLVEASPAALAAPCYLDEGRGLARLVDEELAAAGLAAAAPARAAILGHLGADRLASRQELRKLALYCAGAAEVTEEDVLACMGDVATLAVDAVIDAAAAGDADEAASALARLVGEGADAGVLCAAALRHMSALQRARAEVDRGRSAGEAARALPIKLFFKRQAAFERQLVLWSVERAGRAAALLQDALLDIRRRPGLGVTVLERALLAVAGAARRRG